MRKLGRQETGPNDLNSRQSLFGSRSLPAPIDGILARARNAPFPKPHSGRDPVLSALRGPALRDRGFEGEWSGRVEVGWVTGNPLRSSHLASSCQHLSPHVTFSFLPLHFLSPMLRKFSRQPLLFSSDPASEPEHAVQPSEGDSHASTRRSFWKCWKAGRNSTKSCGAAGN